MLGRNGWKQGEGSKMRTRSAPSSAAESRCVRASMQSDPLPLPLPASSSSSSPAYHLQCGRNRAVVHHHHAIQQLAAQPERLRPRQLDLWGVGKWGRGVWGPDCSIAAALVCHESTE